MSCFEACLKEAADLSKATGFGRSLQLLTGSRARALEKNVASRAGTVARHNSNANALSQKAFRNPTARFDEKQYVSAVGRNQKTHQSMQRSNRVLEQERQAVSGARRDLALGAVGAVGAGTAMAGGTSGQQQPMQPKFANAVDAFASTVRSSRFMRAAQKTVGAATADVTPSQVMDAGHTVAERVAGGARRAARASSNMPPTGAPFSPGQAAASTASKMIVPGYMKHLGVGVGVGGAGGLALRHSHGHDKQAEDLQSQPQPPPPEPAWKRHGKTVGTGLVGLGIGTLAGVGAGELMGHLGGKAGIPAVDIASKVAPAAGGAAGILYSLWQAKQHQELMDALESERNQAAGRVPGQ